MKLHVMEIRLLLIAFLFSFLGYSQKTFHLSSSLGLQKVKVNNEIIEIDSAGIYVETNYPGFDSIQFLRGYQDTMSPILCNFKPDSAYVLIGACCGSVDITTLSRWEQVRNKLEANREYLDTVGFEAELFMAQEILIDRPSYTFQLTEVLEDTVWGWVSDAACFPKIYPVSIGSLDYGLSNKCFYWSNIDYLHFFTQDNLAYWMDDEGVKKYDLPDYETFETIASQAVRFFDNHHFLVTVNPKTNEVYIRYDD